MKQSYIDLALRMAQKSVSEYRLGAVVVRKRRVVSTGFNQMEKTHPIMQKLCENKEASPGIHAEVHASLGVSAKDLDGAELYVARIMKNGLPALARPCSMCLRFLRSVGIQNIYYSKSGGACGKIELVS